jgi:two-component system cell cycle sensor histidine kinase/response regulator CckA
MDMWGSDKDPKGTQESARLPSRPRILVVDDEESIRRFADRALRSAGYDVVVACNGPEALTLVEAQPAFDLYVLDVVMPEMRGDELGRRLRQRDADAKVLYFTGYSDVLFQEKQMLWDNESFAEKPLTIEGLREAVSLLLFGHTRGPQ